MTDLVEKLELPTQPHPHPYYIKWFNSCDNLQKMKNGIDEIFRDTRKDAIVMYSTKSELQNEHIVVPIALDTNILQASENNQGNEVEEKKDEEQKDLSIAPCMLEECLIDQAPTISEDDQKGKDNGATTAQEVLAWAKEKRPNVTNA
uniref:Uncharacterized protein n=2 Tax=Oryza sativa subsp. japonica TaxID=39947 RepID=Q7G443_ORYSJ|nr:hypothetical protein OJ1004_F02.10 [Oryza sativa Japonica Group]AAM18144.1 Hypothetical protein [Oryza sativa Japonica Group]AAP52738.1 hypothetical protein LOC_Os10g13930 [Oryza sativa Japonica Group]